MKTTPLVRSIHFEAREKAARIFGVVMKMLTPTNQLISAVAITTP
jgi:hypothetical protein